MKVISFIGPATGFFGIADTLIRKRLNGIYSHCEVVYEPGDGVDDLMPDGTTEPINGMYWAASSNSFEKMPEWSKLRAGKMGGMRFKRINPFNGNWDVVCLPKSIDARKGAIWAKDNEGRAYNWNLMIGYIAWFIPDNKNRLLCSQAVAAQLGVQEPWRFDPCNVRALAIRIATLNQSF